MTPTVLAAGSGCDAASTLEAVRLGPRATATVTASLSAPALAVDALRRDSDGGDGPGGTSPVAARHGLLVSS